MAEWIELLYEYKGVVISRITVLNIWKLHKHCTTTLSATLKAVIDFLRWVWSNFLGFLLRKALVD